MGPDQKRMAGKAWEVVLFALARLALCLCVVSVPAGAEESRSLNGVALVIGQSAYRHIDALPNPVNDARDIVKLLTDLGFDARGVSDRDAARLTRDLERFVEDAEEADVAFLYYSGHGIEAAGENWLVPVDADVASLDNASQTLVALSSVMERLKTVVPVTIVLLDACRTSPFPAGATIRMTPSGSAAPIGDGGLSPVRGARPLSSEAPATESLGTVIGFAAEPGRPALDGPVGANSPYATALLRHLSAMQGVEFGAVMRMVTEEVYLGTRAQQRPWVNESLRRLLYFGGTADEPTGDDGIIAGERRTLLLTISELPAANRSQVELAAARDGVPLDALYGVLRALGTEKMPEDPAELGRILDAQADRLKEMFSRRDALRTDDPEIARLTGSADRALREGAVQAARAFLDQAIARVEENNDSVEDLEEALRQKRIADAAIYAQRAGASALAFDHVSAADDYARAADMVERWDGKLARQYRFLEGVSLTQGGQERSDRRLLDRAMAVYRTAMSMGDADVQRINRPAVLNNIGLVLQTLGERERATSSLEQAAATFREALDLARAAGDDAVSASAQTNLAAVLVLLGERRGDSAQLSEAIEAYRGALALQDRAKVPDAWATSQINMGVALATLGDRSGDNRHLDAAETAYREALEVHTREKSPLEWAMIQHNLGNIHFSIGTRLNDQERLDAAEASYRAALEIRDREHFPVSWARSRFALAGALSRSTRFAFGTGRLEEAVAAYEDALTVLSLRRFPMDWASVHNNLGSVYQAIGQRRMDAAFLEQSASAFRASMRVYKRRDFPLDWAAAQYNLGNTRRLLATVSGDPGGYAQAAAAYREALLEYGRDTMPRHWALVQSGLAAALQSLSNSEADVGSLVESIAARRAALEVLTMETDPIEWANTQEGLGLGLLNLGTRQMTAEHLDAAQAAFEASLKVFTREAHPLQWAYGQNNLGDIHWSRAAFGGGRESYQRAIAQFELARQGYLEAGNSTPLALLDQKIELVRKAIAGKR